LRQKLAELEKEKEDAAKLAADTEALFQTEREKLAEDKSKWQGKTNSYKKIYRMLYIKNNEEKLKKFVLGKFEEFRQTETDRNQRIEDEEIEKEEREKELNKLMEEKDEEIAQLHKENKKLSSQKEEISEEKDTFNDAMQSTLGKFTITITRKI